MPKAVKSIISGCLVLCLLAVLSGTTVFATMVAYGSEKAGKREGMPDSSYDKKEKE